MTKKIEVTDDKKLASFLRELKNEKYGSANISLIELKNWLEDNSVIPIDKTQPFIVHFEVLLDEKCWMCQPSSYWHYQQMLIMYMSTGHIN